MSGFKHGVADRLLAVMEAFGLQHYRELGDAAGGVNASAVANWFNANPTSPKVENMVALCDRFGLTLDWLYAGRVASILSLIHI